MKALKVILIIAAVLVVAVLLAPMFMKKNYEVKESIIINQDKKLVYEQVANFNNWEYWSPWRDLEQEAEYTVTGTGKDLGDEMSWVGDTVGTGKQIFTKLQPYDMVEAKLMFTSPQEGNSIVWFEFSEVEGGTKVDWHITGDGDMGYFLRLFIPTMETMLGDQFKTGLQKLKTHSEELDMKKLEMTIEDVAAVPIYYTEESIETMDSKMIGEKLGAAYGELMHFVQQNGIQMAGMPIAITTAFDEASGMWNFNPALPVAEASVEPEGRIKVGMTHAGKVLKTVYVGPYNESPEAYNTIMAHIESEGMEVVGNSWEEYANDPADTPEEELITNIYFPIK